MMTTDHAFVRQTLKAKLKEASSINKSSECLLINQIADPADMTREAADRDVAVQILNNESTLVRRLRAAIERTMDGSYGICLHCEDEIASKRLIAIPWAELCIRCQEASDSGAPAERITYMRYRTEEAA
jgi:DnaK suppressor protein